MKTGAKLYANFTRGYSNLLEWAARALIYNGGKDVQKEFDVNYGGEKATVSDLIYTSDLKKGEKRPVLLYIHGGGWVSGLKGTRRYYCYDWARDGYFVMNIHYDYAPKKQFPYQFKQIFKAVEYLYDNAEKYSLDLDRIVVGGESAGAYYTAYVACMSKHHELYDALGVDFKYRDSFDVKGTVLLNGAMDAIAMCKLKFFNMPTFLYAFYDMKVKEILEKQSDEATRYFSPLPFMDEKYPPTVVGRGTHDGLDTESVRVLELLEEKGVVHTSFLAEGLVGVHGFCLATNKPEGKRCFIIARDFINGVLYQQDKESNE